MEGRSVFVDPSERSEIAGALRGLMARTFVPGQHALVKATSFVSELAPLLVGESSLALFLFATPANYVASILAGENSVKELAALRETRLARLAERGIVLTGLDRGEAQWAAAAWACEMVSLEAASDQIGEARILWADFDRMLTDMAAWLGRCAGHLGLAADPDRLAGIVGGPLMGRYSKALEYDYSPALRAELLGEATRHHRAAIVDALGLLRRNAETIPLLARALRRAEPEFQNVSHPATADRR